MDLCQVNSTVLKTCTGNALSLAPPTAAIELSKPRDLPNRRSDRKGLDVRDVANDLEIHRDMFAKQRLGVKPLWLEAA